MKIPVGVFFVNKIVTDSNRKRKKSFITSIRLSCDT